MAAGNGIQVTHEPSTRAREDGSTPIARVAMSDYTGLCDQSSFSFLQEFPDLPCRFC